jgi:ABC-type thiamin/hydroxymethylpyrimidine transport system permease subunit
VGIRKFLNGFSVFQLIIIAIMASLGTATKPIIVPLIHIILGPLYIPGGAIAGGFHMMWMVLGTVIVKKKGTATLIATVQAMMVVALGLFGTHGIVSFLTYIAPGIAIDLVLLVSGKRRNSVTPYFIAGIVANLTGTFMVNLVFFRLPLIPLVLSLSSAALSGGLGGILAWSIGKQVEKFGVDVQ